MPLGRQVLPSRRASPRRVFQLHRSGGRNVDAERVLRIRAARRKPLDQHRCHQHHQDRPGRCARQSAQAGRILRPQPAPLDGPPPGPIRHAAGETPAARPDAHRGARRRRTRTHCARWACSRGSWPPRCPTDPTPSRPIWERSCTTCRASAPAAPPDLGAIAAANPDLILGSQALTPDSYAALSAIAPTVFSAAPGALAGQPPHGGRGHRPPARRRRSDRGFHRAGQEAGEVNDATHFQASVVQLTDSALRVFGADTFPVASWPRSEWIALQRNGLPTSPILRFQ